MSVLQRGRKTHSVSENGAALVPPCASPSRVPWPPAWMTPAGQERKGAEAKALGDPFGRSDWAYLSTVRWGPALEDPEPGIDFEPPF
jgi:hypothetical protein